MSGRKWENLEWDCLVNVFKRVGMESLLLDVPFVCKSWCAASRDPLCWEQVSFSCGRYYGRLKQRFMGVYQTGVLSDAAFAKFIIDRSSEKATVLELPHSSKEALSDYAEDECDKICSRFLGRSLEPLEWIDMIRHSILHYDPSEIVIENIGKWKNLQELVLGKLSSENLLKILPEISLHCKNLESLHVQAYIGENEATSIVINLPKIKKLVFKGTFLPRHNLVKILQGCKELLLLDARNCIGFEADDMIKKLASHVKKFLYEGRELGGIGILNWRYTISDEAMLP